MIQCERAQNASVVLLMAYMLQSAARQNKNLTLQKAYQFVQQKKLDIQPADGESMLERERERKREADGQRQTDRQRESVCVRETSASVVTL